MFLRLRDDLCLKVSDISAFRPVENGETQDKATKTVLYMKTYHPEEIKVELQETVDEVFKALREQGFMPQTTPAPAFAAAAEGGKPAPEQTSTAPQKSGTALSHT